MRVLTITVVLLALAFPLAANAAGDEGAAYRESAGSECCLLGLCHAAGGATNVPGIISGVSVLDRPPDGCYDFEEFSP